MCFVSFIKVSFLVFFLILFILVSVFGLILFVEGCGGRGWFVGMMVLWLDGVVVGC